ncbi:NAD-dependent epimerase/dehydratase family protein [Deinococcus peraridilitoris]|uniref:Nucleoside-diphosphate-sugar epimerase n=1 Tax=Deinococcus peraridilitoris (strain DSM 19664 / LMG 22246 / CIP 109416 / KR-200) TaxID=937777 RepID=K9ZY12_DEIPD|nr:NAD-dependent epimerase/dehydratase family protein [Deinococcus peraridilitoris]AFZ66491.1 nucleoside-diphosphate-sugar epimerase [Deinococcus peraridilitoris DSM 19664]
MMRIGVTGAGGLLGRHLRVHLQGQGDIETVIASRETFHDSARLDAFVRSCDAIAHFAGMNRGDDQEVAATNVRLGHDLTTACERADVAPHLVFSSSIHARRDTPYGASKRECAAIFSAWAERVGAKFYNLVLPNVFGEGGQPFYNSVVSTFCHQVAHGNEPTVHSDALTHQVHAQTVAREVLCVLRDGITGEGELPGRPISVADLLGKLQEFDTLYGQHIFPDVRDEFERDLFNTYRSYLYPCRYPVSLTLHSDPRGSLFEAVRTLNGGQTFLSTTRPGITRGNHYHLHKIERFLVVAGEAEIRIRHVLDTDVEVFRVSGERPSYVDIPTLHTHNITNVGDTEVLTLFWTHELYDSKAPDTYPQEVQL